MLFFSLFLKVWPLLRFKYAGKDFLTILKQPRGPQDVTGARKEFGSQD